MNRPLLFACAIVLLPISSVRGAIVDLLFQPVDAELRSFGPSAWHIPFTPTRDVQLTGFGLVSDPMSGRFDVEFHLWQDDVKDNSDRLASLTSDFTPTGLNRYLFHLADHPELNTPPSITLEQGRRYILFAHFNFGGQWPEQFGDTQDYPFPTTSGSLIVLGGGRGYPTLNREQPPLVVELELEAPLLPRWNVDSNGDWLAVANWSGGIPNGTSARAIFGGVITQTRDVTVTGPVKVGAIDFNNANAYTLTGTAPITLETTSGMPAIDVIKGNHVIAAPLRLNQDTLITVRPPASGLSINALEAGPITLTKDGPGSLTLNNIRVDTLAIDWGTVKVAPSGTAAGTSIVRTLAISAGSTLDLTDNAAVIDYTGNSPAATIRQQIRNGRGGPNLGKTWNGQGITSSEATAAEPESRSVAYAENSSLPLGPFSSFGGQPVDDTSVLVAYTRTGDANLDGVINDADVTIVSATYLPGVPNPHWALGDFDYDGFIDEDDVTLLGVFYDPSATPLIASGNVAAVPEPTSWLLVLVCCLSIAIFALSKGRRARLRRCPPQTDRMRPLASPKRERIEPRCGVALRAVVDWLSSDPCLY